MAHEQLTPEWSRPVASIEMVLNAAAFAADHIDHLPEAVQPELVRNEMRLQEDLHDFSRQMHRYVERRYPAALRIVHEEAGIYNKDQFAYETPDLAWNILYSSGLDSYGNLYRSEGLHIYDNPDNPYDITHRYYRVWRALRPAFLPTTIRSHNPQEMHALYERFMAVEQYSGKISLHLVDANNSVEDLQ